MRLLIQLAASSNYTVKYVEGLLEEIGWLTVLVLILLVSFQFRGRYLHLIFLKLVSRPKRHCNVHCIIVCYTFAKDMLLFWKILTSCVFSNRISKHGENTPN